MDSVWPLLALTLVFLATVDAGAIKKRGLVGDIMGGLVNTKASYIEEWRRPRGLIGDVFAGAVNTKGSYNEVNSRPRGLVGDIFLGLINTKLQYVEEWLQGRGADDKIKQLYGLGGQLSLTLADLISQILEVLIVNLLDDDQPTT